MARNNFIFKGVAKDPCNSGGYKGVVLEMECREVKNFPVSLL
jgi:hypothetical protein